MTQPNKYQIDAMDAVFAFSEAMTEGDLTILDLQNVIRLAVADGHEMLQIQIAMLSVALEKETQTFLLNETNSP